MNRAGGVLFNRRMQTTAAAVLGALLMLAFAPGARGEPEKPTETDPGGTEYASGELLVTYKTGLAAPDARRARSAVNGTVEENLRAVDAQLLTFPEVQREPSGEERQQALGEKKKQLERDPAVESVDYNYLYEFNAAPNDPLYGRQWGLERIEAPRAWTKERGNGGRIAIVDSGIDDDHPDLRTKIAAQRDVVNDDDVAEDFTGHGTHVSGIAAAATGNNRGVAGVCPGCEILVAKVEEAGGIFLDDLVEGINWSVDNGAQAINLSISGPPASALARAVNQAWDRGAVVVASAGNDGSSRGNIYPAAYSNVIAVSATDKRDRRTAYSNFGRWVDVAAPGGTSGGGAIFSTLPNRYGYMSGTSMAAPHVTGIAGLLASRGLPNARIRERIQATAVDLGRAGRDRFYGHGRVNAAAAVGARPENTAPTVTRLRPGPGSKVRGRTVTISAKVRDAQTDLKKSDITLLVDGRRVSFRYNERNDRLSTRRKLPPARHTARVIAHDGKGLRESRRWSFSVVEERSGHPEERKKPRKARGRTAPLRSLIGDVGWPSLFPDRWPLGILR